ncbi:KH domain-containing protein HEN4-like isoform X2 [Phalaenopsis equestris]|uniref:KH domain-containing protein HEN4-like isoform X2 n=1 Tax=Phalaenopsis equestris TaxID=78828 RepID=UPI0009E5F574|nr:KH domain-containing protein HEN4-like isoform X2 [Phalaenopsis equestris]
MEGSSTGAGMRPDDSSPSSGGAEPTYVSPNSSNTADSTRRHGPSGPPSMPGAACETVFRLLCPSDKIGSVVGKGGAVIRQIQKDTGTWVQIEDPVLGSDDRVVRVVADAILRRRREGGVADSEEEASPAQQALVKVFELILRGEEGEGGDKELQGTASCRLLAPGSHVGCVLGKGGKIVEKIRLESGAKIRVFPMESVPPCAVAGDELIQISGSFLAVKKALLAVSSCLQDNIRADATTFSTPKPYTGSLQGPIPHAPLDSFPQRGYLVSPHGFDYQHKAYSSNPTLDNNLSGLRKLPEEEISFRLLCTNDKVGSVIGKSGAIVRSLQNETGAAIKVIDAVGDSDDRIILISAHESYELKHSPAQDAVLRVHSRLAEAFTDKGLVSARLLVPAQQIGCLLGKGGSIIAEMRRMTGANIKIFMKEQVPRCAQPKDELVQVSGSFQSVREALIHITNRIRESFFPPKHYPYIGMSQHHSVVLEMPPIMPRNDAPPVRYAAVGFPRVLDPSIESTRNLPASSPKLWTHKSGDPDGLAAGSATQAAISPNRTVTIAVPEHYMGFVHGESDDNLALIREVEIRGR